MIERLFGRLLRMWLARLATVLASAACADDPRRVVPDAASDADGPAADAFVCENGALSCDANDLLVCADGKFDFSKTCPNACYAPIGCVECVPGTGTCEGDISHACNDNGIGTYEVFCDPLQGVTCSAQNGLCEGPCVPNELSKSYIGCDYYPTVTANIVNNAFENNFAVAISNTHMEAGTVTIEGGEFGAIPLTLEIDSGETVVQTLPFVPLLKACDLECSAGCPAAQLDGEYVRGALVGRGAYRVRSTVPVTVYQFNALDYEIAGGKKGVVRSYTNDASLLFPVNAMDLTYVVASWPTCARLGGRSTRLVPGHSHRRDGSRHEHHLRSVRAGGSQHRGGRAVHRNHNGP